MPEQGRFIESAPTGLVEEVEGRVHQFERAWLAGSSPRLEDYLPAEQPARHHCLIELLHTDLEFRIKRGIVARVEDYLRRFPELGSDGPALLELVRKEYALRSRDAAESVAGASGGGTADQQGQPAAPAPPQAQGGRLVGGYVLLEEIGRGGVGVVYRAWQPSLKRPVALKMILAGGHGGPELRARFRAEAEIAAGLHHPNIVPIYEIGEHEGLPFSTLEFLPGGSLARKIDGMPLPPHEAARIARDIALGADAAHRQGLVHRDLKPANVLLTRHGIPKITDFGLARYVDADSTTSGGVILGTPSYMAPEQATGQGNVGPAADVHAIGAILYEMLTGRPPFRGETAMETLLLVRTREPRLPSLVQPDVPRPLELICMTCLAKSPGQRYPSAQALSEDLERFLVGDPVVARARSLRHRAVRLFRDHPLVAFVTASGGAAAAGLAAGSALSGPMLGGIGAAVGAVAGGSWLYGRLRGRLRQSNFEQLTAECTADRLHFVLERVGQLVATRDLDRVLQLLAQTASYLVHAEHATVYLIDHERGEVWSRVLLDKALSEIRVPLGRGIAGTVAATGETINLPDAYDDPRFNRDIDVQTGQHTRSLLTVAMKDRSGRPVGVFQLMNKRTGSFTRDDIALLGWLRDAALIAIQNAEGLPITPPPADVPGH